MKYEPLLKIPGQYVYTVFVRTDHGVVKDLKDLRGHKICAHAPPHLGTMVLFSEFDNPMRQPVLMVTRGYDHVFERVLAGECEAGVLSEKSLARFDQDGKKTRVIYRHQALPNYALSVSQRFSSEERIKMATALQTPAGMTAMAKLREAYKIEGNLSATSAQEYSGLGRYLMGEWGYQ